MTNKTNILPAVLNHSAALSRLDQLALIPEEEVWLHKQKSARTRRAYRLDAQHFMRTLGITTPEELRQADHKAVIAWERYMRETEHAASSTIRRRLAALSSLHKHLVRHGHAAKNPVGEVERPAITTSSTTIRARSTAGCRPSPARSAHRRRLASLRRRRRPRSAPTPSTTRPGCAAPQTGRRSAN
jgi:integrase family protein with SAM-like domain